MSLFNDMYFHGLAGNAIVFNDNEYVINISLLQLENILITGGIYSRNKLKEHNHLHHNIQHLNKNYLRHFLNLCIY